ncbi:high mobility group protein 20A [Topomyia yanbarensis]|uniref:high mobility group protein 20A n=1 Tax=Topomyia yanbarensis TaxID=2498891 RepID=UPI00273BD80B|nr:high mobility group protein 20A [Topomyia yanbarensis]
MDKSTESENSPSATGKQPKNGPSKERPKASDQALQQPPQKPVAKRKRKKRAKDANAPKHPLTGYVRYMNEKRDSFRAKHPTLTSVDITKLLAEEWGTLTDEVKRPYLEAAEADRERYHREVSEYKQQSNNEPATANSKKLKTNGDDSDTTGTYLNGKDDKREIRVGDYEIPIFTDDFLEHNKVIDSELRMLRKSNIDYEQQNSVLEKHVENMDNGIQKLENETNGLKNRNVILQTHLEKLRSVLAIALAGLPIGNEKKGATVDNIDKYMSDLHQMAKSSTHGHTLNKAKDIIRKLDLQSLAA